MKEWKFSKKDLEKKTCIGKRRFSNRSDYESYFIKKNYFSNSSEIWRNEYAIKKIHQSWHTQGQSGCLFAHAISKDLEKHKWKTHIILDESIPEYELLTIIDNKLESALLDAECELLSFIFPTITDINDLCILINILNKTKNIYLESESIYDDMTTLKLRTKVQEGITAWIMGFGPFTFLPNTRQSPMTEIVLRVKPKHDKLFPKLNQDTSIAHTADIPIFFDEAVSNKLWDGTFKNTELILGGKPNELSAAKTTFSIPTRIWNSIRVSLIQKIN